MTYVKKDGVVWKIFLCKVGLLNFKMIKLAKKRNLRSLNSHFLDILKIFQFPKSQFQRRSKSMFI